MKMSETKLMTVVLCGLSFSNYAAAYNDLNGCNGQFLTGQYQDVIVNEDDSCVLGDGVIIHGSLKAIKPATLRSLGATIHGDVIVDGAKGDVQIQASRVQNATTHIYGNVTIRNSVATTSDVGFPPFVDLERGLFVGGSYPLFSPEGAPPPSNLPIATLHIHGNLTFKNNELQILNVPFLFAANNLLSIGKLNSRQIVDGNISIAANRGYRLQGYSNTVSGNITINNNHAVDMAYGCDTVDGNVNITNNNIVGDNYPLDPPNESPTISVAALDYASKCSDQVAAEISFAPPGTFPPDLVQAFPNGVIKGNLNVKNNVVRRLNDEDVDQLTVAVANVKWLNVLGNVLINNNEAIAPVTISYPFPIPNIEQIGLYGSDVAVTVNCSNNNPALSASAPPNIPPIPTPANDFGKDNCF